MPAITPALLKQQAALLGDQYDSPAAFVRSLHHLLEFYADRAHRPGQTSLPPTLSPAYKVRPQVLRLVLQELVARASDEPEAGLILCDALWEQPVIEFRILAADLLGHIASPTADPILQRIYSWSQPDLEERLLNELLDHGLAGLRKDYPGDVVNLIRNWLGSEQRFEQHLGLRALLPVVNDYDFENLPVVFRLIQPLVRVTPPALRPELLDVLGALANRSPGEAAYFLRQTVSLPNSPDTPLLIRQCIKEFPATIQDDLRKIVRSAL
jgi:hypothetical protein